MDQPTAGSKVLCIDDTPEVRLLARRLLPPHYTIIEAGVAGKTVVVASSLRVEWAMALMQAGARDVLLKPCTLAALADIVGK